MLGSPDLPLPLVDFDIKHQLAADVAPHKPE